MVLYDSDEARARLQTFVDLGDKIEEYGEKRRARKAEIGIAELGSLPSNL